MGACGICNENIARNEKIKIDCGQCKHIFHACCVGLTDVELQVISKANPWTCMKCIKSKRLSRSLTDGDIVVGPAFSNAVFEESSDVLTVDKVRSLLNESMGDLLRKIDERVNSNLSPIRADINANSALLKELRDTIKSQKETIKSLELKNAHLESKLDKVTTELDKLTTEMDDYQQYSRRNCVEIFGVPEVKDEDVSKILVDVGKSINFNKDMEAAVINCHRLKKRNNMSTAGIIVRFLKPKVAELFLNSKKKKGVLTPKDIGLNGSNSIFVNASLTAKRRVLFGKAKLLLKSGVIKYLWVDHSGRVKVRVVEGGPVLVVRTDSDLNALSTARD